MTVRSPVKTIGVILVAAAVSTACKPEATQPEPTQPPPTPRAKPDSGLSGIPFGSADLGFVSWLQARGAFAVVHQFDSDTNNDGSIDPKFGDHGEPEGDWPSVWTYPLPEGAGERWDEFITSDAQDRWAVLRRGSELVAVSAHKRWPLQNADIRPDPSPCAHARQASIDPTGTWLTFLRTQPDRAVVKHLGTGVEREVPAIGLLWRAHAMPRGWVMLREVREDTDGDGSIEMPRRQGTCICRWCSRFASSVGSGRFVGDHGVESVVDAAGNRVDAPTAPVGLGPNAIWSMSRRLLVGADGNPRKLADGCVMKILPLGSELMVLNCRGETKLWNTASGASVAIEQHVEAVDVYALPVEGWIPVAILDDAKKSFGRLNLDNGLVEEGPPMLRVARPHPSGWRLVADDEHVYAYDISTGTWNVLQAKIGEMRGLVGETKDGWVVVDPGKKEPVARLPRAPEFVASNGCFVRPTNRRRPAAGPFEWICP